MPDVKIFMHKTMKEKPARGMAVNLLTATKSLDTML